MAVAIFDELARPEPKRHFTVGIVDDVTHLSLKHDPVVQHRGGRRHPGRLLRVRQRRHGGGEQELGQDHRREHAALRAGLLRLRLEEVGLDDRLAPAVQPAPDPVLVPDRAGELRRLPPVRLPGADRRAGGGRARGHLPAEQPLSRGPGLERAADGGPGADHPQGAQVLRGGRPGGGARGGARRADQHGDADLLLRALGRPAEGRGDRQDQGFHQEDLRQARRGRPGPQLRRRRRRARRPPRGGRPGPGQRREDLAPADLRRRPRLRQAGHADDDRGQGRTAPGQRPAGRRHLPDGDHPLREAEHRPGNPDLGPGHLHPVRPLRPGLPALHHPDQGLRRVGPGRGARDRSSRCRGAARSSPATG